VSRRVQISDKMHYVLHAALLCVILTDMSTSPEHEKVPQWDLADRLGKALREAHMSVNEMALYLGVHRNTVGAWINGRAPIGGPAIRAWAIRTGVRYEWLRDGNPSTPTPPAHPFRQAGATVARGRLRPVPADDIAEIDDDAMAYLRLAECDGNPSDSKSATLRLTAECSAGLSYRGLPYDFTAPPNRADDRQAA
jgi:transcriptional regulator with XRE-family HTH domain